MERLLAHRTLPFDRVAVWLNEFAGLRLLADSVPVALALWLLGTRRWQPVATLVGAGAGSVAATTVLKAIIDRPRPSSSNWLLMAHGSSMPSSVAAMVAGVCAAAVLVSRGSVPAMRRAVIALAVLLSVVAGLAVVYVGVHWPTDVLAGWLLGVGVAVAVDWLVRLVDRGRFWPSGTSDAVVDAEQAGTADGLHAS
jgi:membrane-associated phospholipid phosphatase